MAVLALDGVVSFDLGVACQAFAPWRADEPSEAAHAARFAPWYAVRVCAGRPGAGPHPVPTADGFALTVPAGLAALARADTVVVPGLAPGAPRVAPPVLAALRRAHARGARVVSICTGAFVLAAAGLLDGRRATTHWAAAGRLAARYPRVAVDPAVLYVAGSVAGSAAGNTGGVGDTEDAAGARVLTSAGMAAGLDLCLALVRADYGTAAANAAARRLVVAPHRGGGQAQYAETPVPAADGPEGGGLEATRAWALARLAAPLTVDALARHAGVSRRTFDRRFRAETGTTPLQWLVAQRVLAARGLLEDTDHPVARVAALAGFGDALSLRQHFARATGTAPLAYRRAFRGAPPAGTPPASGTLGGSHCVGDATRADRGSDRAPA